MGELVRKIVSEPSFSTRPENESIPKLTKINGYKLKITFKFQAVLIIKFNTLFDSASHIIVIAKVSADKTNT